MLSVHKAAVDAWSHVDWPASHGRRLVLLAQSSDGVVLRHGLSSSAI